MFLPKPAAKCENINLDVPEGSLRKMRNAKNRFGIESICTSVVHMYAQVDNNVPLAVT